MKLRELLEKVSSLPPFSSHPALDQNVTGLSTNSHACQPGDLFIGMPGTRVDGGDFWPGAIAAGAIAAVVSPTAFAKTSPPQVGESCVIAATDIIQTCAELATAFYNYPAQTLKLIGITGTNGKTTTTHLVEFLLSRGEKSTALLGTLYTRWPGFQKIAAHTTPFAVELQSQLAEAVAAGCEYGVMEVSSHALHQGRVLGCPFQVAVFTNLTQDHLDYHPTMEDYFAAKALLFNDSYLQGRAVINLDDPYGKRLLEKLGERAWSYSIADHSADLWADQLNYQPTGVAGILHTPAGNTEFFLPLVGQYNLSNLLAATGAGLAVGLDLDSMAQCLPEFIGVPGRMERVQISPDQDISVIVDYAHTPDSLENLLKASRPFIPGKMICVFGCGGDRDRTKRPKMGKITAELADVAVVTSDNPRTEDPHQILQDVQAGISAEYQPIVICDRAEAIAQAIQEAQPGDGVLIAGKGHEDYQILGTEKVHFDDREQAREALEKRLKG
ncbi:MAG: UDP-N-acetylmuramoyl-L-alanyl-D-glutamate--2,6-diaminopimelate ligase [Oscillatoriales cyanobacterium RM2_1_1]|nr:UDP-N-acetylmuramoyl-L-alanyl-D-glutamate--2,6-diaminopimelate ligase [Oscillatoriales cyanobacterium SM2_3_0]NJO47554.1 UDP-N-acetylmuramoyl-L-alanyl-D-glutamate--2,6-diaminopimelate ligase [Oscillatoriales cyanobacterium RM2_1_1]